MITHIRKVLAFGLSSTLLLSGCGTGLTLTPLPVAPAPTTSSAAIKHVVVIFSENRSFDHYFGTYPNAANLPGDKSQFTAAANTPIPNNYISNPSLLTSNPFRLDIGQAATASQDHNYGPEQLAFDGGKMDLFPLSVGTADSLTLAQSTGAPTVASSTALTMGYFDGNTVTGLWNYAQHYALNDHSFGTTFGPSTPGAINLISGQTNGVINPVGNVASAIVADGVGGYTDINDADPAGDLCTPGAGFSMSGKNIGDLLNTKNVTWGWFQGGFNLGLTNANGTTGCLRTTKSAVTGVTEPDYIQHHQPFQYYASTANLNHTRPTSTVAIGAADPNGANHQYDIQDFNAALAAGNMPSVSFLKAQGYQDGHGSYSDPLDEQNFMVTEINAIEQSPLWSSTAIIIAYDDSDGWYDHLTDFVNGSKTASDSAFCTGSAAALSGPNSNGAAVQGRCGHGPRLPFLVISPWAKKNYIDSTQTDQSSIIRFIEDTFLSSQRIGNGSYDATAGSINAMFDFSNGSAAPNPNVVVLDPNTGLVTSKN